jgi:hypothetical protein
LWYVIADSSSSDGRIQEIKLLACYIDNRKRSADQRNSEATYAEEAAEHGRTFWIGAVDKSGPTTAAARETINEEDSP